MGVNMKRFVIAIAFLLCQVLANFTPHFNAFLRNRYGEAVQRKLERRDLGHGMSASFGGKDSDANYARKRPIIFVHGVTGRAVHFLGHRGFFLGRGYHSGELYATTYGDGGVTGMYDNPITCDIVKQIRYLIMAVSEYTGRKVDIIAWSMGAPVTRKAILGGRCLDTGEYIGAPLTDKIDTCIVVGGTNYGIQWCPDGKSGCNHVNSMHCSSQLLAELNSQPARYEGKHSYAIYTNEDPIVGRFCCGRDCGKLRHATDTVVEKSLDHIGILTTTIQTQYDFLNH